MASLESPLSPSMVGSLLVAFLMRFSPSFHMQGILMSLEAKAECNAYGNKSISG